MPLSVPITITENPRFQRMLADYQVLVREQLICGMQVHVGIGDRDLAAALIDRVARWLPPLLALSASSPFLARRARHRVRQHAHADLVPLADDRVCGDVRQRRRIRRLVQDLIGSGVISDRGMIYFDVRPSSHAPTLELRVCDACPSVDTAVLIAGLFRAVVTRERSPGPRGAVADAVRRHRGRRCGGPRALRLEGELVDISGPHPVPAGVLLRSMVDELRPELEADGAWLVVGELCEAALAHGSSAARQREALRKHARIADVVDLFIAETRWTHARRARPPSQPLLPGYHAGGYDEAVRADGQPRPSHATVLETLASLPAAALRAQVAALEHAKEPMGLVFRSTGQTAATSFHVDIVPRVVAAEEWSRLQGGAAQRARALEAFLNDIYGERQIVRDGVVPAWVATKRPGCAWPVRLFRAGNAASRWPASTSCATATAAGWCWRTTSACRRVWRTPSLAAACCAARCPELVGAVDLHDPEEAPALLRRTLAESAPAACAGHAHSLACSRRGRTTRRTSSTGCWRRRWASPS